LWLRPHENQIDLAQASDDIVVTSFPYSLSSETLQRTTFYTAALETNKNSVIVLEEPEAHSFPGETKLIAEQIALDENGNQYFVVTHNPYFLMPLLSKAPKDDIAINIVYTEDDYQTKVKGLKPEDLPELFELDIFANLSRYIED
jgi:AAA15 family ATPase/GTPase